MGIGGEERERPRLVTAVFGQMERHLPEKVEPRVDRCQHGGQASRCRRRLRTDSGSQFVPDPPQRRGIEVVEATHRRGGGDHRRQGKGIRWRQDRCRLFVGCRLQECPAGVLGEPADRLHDLPRTATEVGHVWWHADAVGKPGQMEQSSSLPVGKGGGNCDSLRRCPGDLVGRLDSLVNQLSMGRDTDASRESSRGCRWPRCRWHGGDTPCRAGKKYATSVIPQAGHRIPAATASEA